MRILFVGGGTLGSVTPLLAVAEEFERDRRRVYEKIEIVFWGTRRGPERPLVEAVGIPFRAIPAGKIRRYGDIRNVLDVFVIAFAFSWSFLLLATKRPSVIVGAGSYVQVPVMWAAVLLRIPIVIHQLDARPTLSNRLVAPFATVITATFPESRAAYGDRVRVLGSPIRTSIASARSIDPRAAKRRFGFSGDRPVILCLGGGTGARALNVLVWDALPGLTARADVIHLTGKGKGSADTQRATRNAQHYRACELLTDELSYAYAAADLVVARAGMGTIAELGSLRKPTVLIPIPGTHQEENVRVLLERRAVQAWDQRELDRAVLTERVLTLLRDGTAREQLGAALACVFPDGAAAHLAEIVRAAAAT